MEENKLEYIKFVEENNIDLKKIPTKVKNDIHALNALVGRMKTSPTPKLQDGIYKMDIFISDALADWTEENIEDWEEGNTELIIEEKEVEKKATEEKVKKEAPPTLNVPKITETTHPTPEPTPAPLKNQNIDDMVAKIREKLNDKNIIDSKELSIIIKRNPAYPKQQVGNLTLEKVFLRNEYRLIKG